MNTAVELEPARRTTRVIVVEDQQTFAEALAEVFLHQGDLDCVGIAGTGAEALKLVVLERPDVAVVDVGLPDIHGTELCRRLRAAVEGMHVVMLTADPRPEVAADAARAGAGAFLSKGASLATILAAVRDRHDHAFVLDATLLLDMMRERRHETAMDQLTARERQLLQLMGRGLDSRAIAREMHLSPHTTRDYTKVLYRKLEVHSQLEAVLKALRSGELNLGA